MDKKHPATYTKVLLPVFADMLQGCESVLDPFAGIGTIFQLQDLLPNIKIEAIEIEPDWDNMHPSVTIGNALHLPWPDNSFDAICVSPVYANRMSDHHNAKDGSKRITYTHRIGHKLHPDNSGAMQWGDSYRTLHVAAWIETQRVLRPGGKFILNMKDHIRNHKRQFVTDWHIAALCAIGFDVVQHVQVVCPGMRYGQNRDERIAYESVIEFRNSFNSP